jgi:hypothetical protein
MEKIINATKTFASLTPHPFRLAAIVAPFPPVLSSVTPFGG